MDHLIDVLIAVVTGVAILTLISLGLAVTLTVVGMAFLYARNRFSKPGAGTRWTHLLPIFSAATITLVGIGLCVGALKSFSF